MSVLTYDIMKSHSEKWSPTASPPDDAVAAVALEIAAQPANPMRSLVESIMASRPTSTSVDVTPNCSMSWARLVAATTHTELTGALCPPSGSTLARADPVVSTSPPSEKEQSDLRLDPARFKTKLCRHYLKMGCCPYMDRCVFSHGKSELR